MCDKALDYRYAGSGLAGRRFPLVAPAVLVLISSSLGCHDPERKAMRAARRGNMDALVKAYQAGSADRPGNIEALAELYSRHNARREAALKRALKRAGKSILSNDDAWTKYKPARLKHVRAIKNGKPDGIPKTFKQMVH